MVCFRKLCGEVRDVMDWYVKYNQEVLACRRCSARKEALYPVPGIGRGDADIVLIGRNPGITENRIGMPFVGAAGLVLDKFLVLNGLLRKDVFITNLILCHTKKNRFLSKLEVRTCVKSFLFPSIFKIQPKVIVVFGAQPNLFLNGIESINTYTGKKYWHKHFNCWMIPSIHPAGVCYDPSKFKLLEKVSIVLREVLKDVG